MDIWQYIKNEMIDLPSLYFAHERPVFERNGMLLGKEDFISVESDELVETRQVRFRTIGDATCTGAIESNAKTLDDIIAEVAAARQTERDLVAAVKALTETKDDLGERRDGESVLRTYGIGAQILRDLGVSRMRVRLPGVIGSEANG